MKNKKILSLFTAMAIILSLCAAIPVSAATESAVYLIADFEDGTIGNTDGNTYTLVDGPGVSQNALKVTDGATLPAFDFGLRSQTTYSDATWKYNVSAWIRADETVSSDKVEFVFYNSYGIKVYTHTVSSAGLATGEWVKIKSVIEYTGTSITSGTVKVKVGGGIAYTMDDLVIMPDKYTPQQSKTQNPILATKLDDMSTVATSTSPWKVSNATAYEFTTAYSGTSVTAFGETEIIGNAVTITNTDYYSELDYVGANFKFGTEYTVEFMAKAENADAVNMTPKVILTYYNNGDSNLGEWSQFSSYKGSPSYTDVASGALADGWKKFKVNVWVNKITQVTNKTNVCFRLYGDNATTAQWSIANIDMYPAKSEFTNLSAVSHFTGNRLSDGTIHADLSTSLMTGQYKAFESRLELPYGDDYVIYKRYCDSENEDSFVYDGAEIENARLVTNICDKDNYFSETMIRPIEIKATGLTAAAEIDQTVWAADMPNLTATVRYNDASGTETLMAMCAMYDENGKMLSHDAQELDIVEGEGEVKLSMDTVSDAKNATVYLWEDGTMSPRLDKGAQITKTETGNFIYVDGTNGKSNSTYGYANPVKTVNQAVTAAKNLSGNGYDTYIILMPGRQPVTKEVAITEAMTDASHSLTFVSYDKNDKGVISGAEDISGTFTYYENGIYRAAVTRGLDARQLYVNGVMATKARTRDLDTTDFENTTIRNATNSHIMDELGPLKTSSSEFTWLKDVKNPTDLEFVFYAYWTMNRCQVASVTENEDGSISFEMDSPGWHSLNTQYNTYARTPSYIENAYEFIDEPGEWYYDSEEGAVYYMPRATDDMATASVMFPRMIDNDKQYLVSVEGTDTESVQNLKFENIAFSHTTWNRPSTAVGHVAAQDNLLSDYYEDASSEKYSEERLRSIESAIDIQNASNISFEGCEFSKLGGNGIRIFWNVQNCDIRGCEFYDIASSALQIADYNTEDETKFGLLHYDANVSGITISDNYIHHTGREFRSAAAISVAWARDVVIEHNEICYTPYSGMHIGLGWEAGADVEAYDLTIDVKNNYLHDIFCYGKIYDGAPIYTNGLTGATADAPNEISGNYITDVGPGAASIYNDEGSTYYYVHDNVMDVRNTWSECEEVLGVERGTALTQNINLTSTVRSHGLTWKNNYVATRKATVQEKVYLDSTNDIDNCIQIGTSGDWCDEAKTIMAQAGIRDEYMDNFGGLRKLSMVDEISLEIDEVSDLKPVMLTAKGEAYKNNSLKITAVSSDETVVSIENGMPVGEGAGVAAVTYQVVENGVLYTAETEVSVAMPEDYIADLSAYSMSFENGGSLRLMKSGIGYYNVQESAETTNGSETFIIVENPKGSGKVVKLDLAESLNGDASSIAYSLNTASSSTGVAKGVLKPGETVTFTFKYYWAQEMSADNSPAFCIYNATGGVFATGTDFKTESGKWHTATLTYTNTTGSDIEIGNSQIRFCGANNPARTWTAAGHSGYVKGGTSDLGARTVYIDSVTATIK